MSDQDAPEPGWPLVLVGLPGAGKSTVGPLVAARLGVPFIDLDDRIERREGRRVAELFAERGEAAFRALERELTRELLGERAVVAPGGGWMVDSDNPGLLRPGARIVHLHVEPHSALRRIGPAGAGRPLLAGPDPAAALVSLAARRAAAYARADAVVNTESLTPQEVADAVCALRWRF